MGSGDDASLQIRPFDRATDLGAVERLWREALDPLWPVLPDGLAILHEGHVALRDGTLAGLVAIDRLGSVTFLAVAPRLQRQGIGRELVERAVMDLRRTGLDRVTAGSGGRAWVWPGVPTDRPDALAFFDALGWVEDGVTTDLVQDLGSSEVEERLAAARPPPGVELALAAADPTRTAAALAFEDAHFPQWSQAFRESRDDILVAQDPAGTVLGTLLLAGPGRVSTYWPMLGEDCATISCVGVSPDQEGRGVGSAMVAFATRVLAGRGAGLCHVDWVARVTFYTRLGYHPWRTFSMRSLQLSP